MPQRHYWYLGAPPPPRSEDFTIGYYCRYDLEQKNYYSATSIFEALCFTGAAKIACSTRTSLQSEQRTNVLSSDLTDLFPETAI